MRSSARKAWRSCACPIERLGRTPNVLLTMRGRRSGKLRTVPIGMIELDGRSFVQASYGEIGWVANLRAD
ncbi:MAG TPA: nitroreductase/quinone reductase family protein, partial [Candidatus Dormibacteraeota bacterium]|nr:nitroreductase/quinone reductase family protein [Candidatus Dormibacteraeota bacterium]